jgi:hypothetical protein
MRRLVGFIDTVGQVMGMECGWGIRTPRCLPADTLSSVHKTLSHHSL